MIFKKSVLELEMKYEGCNLKIKNSYPLGIEQKYEHYKTIKIYE